MLVRRERDFINSGTDLSFLGRVLGMSRLQKASSLRAGVLFGSLLVLEYTKQCLAHSRHTTGIFGKNLGDSQADTLAGIFLEVALDTRLLP